MVKKEKAYTHLNRPYGGEDQLELDYYEPDVAQKSENSDEGD